jgi:hypothetical protein
MASEPLTCDFQPTGEHNPAGTALYQCANCQRGPWASAVGRFAPVVCRNGNGGLGDIAAASIKFATFGLVKPCGGCKERQAALNSILPRKPRA